MNWITAVAASALIFIVLFDAFEVMILPRRINRAFRPARLYYRFTWFVWRRASCLWLAGRWRHGFLSVFGPLSLLGLISWWAAGLIVGFAALHWSLGTALTSPGDAPNGFATSLYFSGTTFVTLGYGDFVPARVGGRMLSMVEAGLGFGFLAIVVSYLPVLYQAFSRREITISLLDARAGSPPTAGELLRRLAAARSLKMADALLGEWERWAAELLESQVSFQAVSYYRSQHDNQSWIAALTLILDTSALLIAGMDAANDQQARWTFAMARHAAVDLSLIFHTPPISVADDRLPPAEFERLRDSLREAGLAFRNGPAVEGALAELRALYEPFVNSLASHFQFDVPPFMPTGRPIDNWQTSAWTRRTAGLGNLPTAGGAADIH